jgi:hypothetical protein
MDRSFRRAFTRSMSEGYGLAGAVGEGARLSARGVRAPPRFPDRFSPVFVLAPARSCSSVITTMIGQHPDLAGMPELKLFCCPTIGELAATLPQYWIDRGKTHRSPGLVRALAEFEFGGQEPDALAAAQDWLRERADWSGADVFDSLMSRLEPRVAVEKSPENVADDASLERLANAYPAARYIHLTRHPVAAQRSMELHLRRVIDGYAALGEPMVGIAAWYEVHTRIQSFCAGLPDNRHMRLRAEEVLDDPDATLSGVTAFLGVSADVHALEAMKRPEASAFARLAPCGGVGGGNDIGFLTDPELRKVDLPPSLAPPCGWKLDIAVWRAVADLARGFGYVDEGGGDVW